MYHYCFFPLEWSWKRFHWCHNWSCVLNDVNIPILIGDIISPRPRTDKHEIKAFNKFVYLVCEVEHSMQTNEKNSVKDVSILGLPTKDHGGGVVRFLLKLSYSLFPLPPRW